MSDAPIDFGRVGTAILRWLSSPSTTILLSLSYVAWTLARIASHATTTEQKGPDE